MRFDIRGFVLTLGCTGGILSLLDFAWFAYDGSNIDYCLPFLIGVFAGAAIGSLRGRS